MKPAAVLLAVLAATALAAEMTGMRIAVYSGSAGGLLMGLVGYGFACKIAEVARLEREKKKGRWDVWALWVGGFLARLVLLGSIALAFGHWLDSGGHIALLSMATVYLVLLFIETWWLMQQLVGPATRSGT